jgi:hypothetical protein
MILINNPILLGRLATVPFAILEWSVVLWYAKSLSFPNFFKRLLAALVSVSLIFGVLFGQFYAYRMATHTSHVIDHFVSYVVGVESIISLILFFYLLNRVRPVRRESK